MVEWDNYSDKIVDSLKVGLTYENSPFQAEERMTRYFPNQCHVCHILDKEEHRLKKCSRCMLISYCTKEHQIQDWKRHKDLCAALAELGGPKLFDDLKKMKIPPNASLQMRIELSKERVKLKGELLSKLVSKLKRKPFLYELQLMDYPRICTVCFENDPSLLVSCSNCPQSSFCVNHLQDSFHSKICSKLKLAAEIELDICGREIFALKMKEVKFLSQKRDTPLPNSMQDFLKNNSYVQVKRKAFYQAILSNQLFDVYLTDAISSPLTLIYAMKKLDFQVQTSLVMHIVGSTKQEVKDTFWELILHWFPNLTHLEILFFGAEVTECEKISVSVCESCKHRNVKLELQVYEGLYQKYEFIERRLKPHIVAAFNAGIHAYDDWIPALRRISYLKTPLVLTAYTELEAHRDHQWMIKFMPTIKYLSLERNPFASFTFERNADDEKVFTKNEFVTIYDVL